MSDSLGLLFILSFLAAVILVPMWLRHRLYKLQLDAVAKALELGVDPERIQLKLPTEKDDPNGNWKAGWILIGIAVAFVLFVLTPLVAAGEIGNRDPESWVILVVPGTLVTIGSMLLFFHSRIVGRVYRHDEVRPNRTDIGGLA